jgi:hypothetical protein
MVSSEDINKLAGYCTPETAIQIYQRAGALNVKGYNEALAFNKNYIDSEGWIPIYSVGLDGFNGVKDAKFMDAITEVEKALIPNEEGQPSAGFVDFLSDKIIREGGMAEISYTSADKKVSYYPKRDEGMTKIVQRLDKKGNITDESIEKATEKEGQAVLLDLIIISQKVSLI